MRRPITLIYVLLLQQIQSNFVIVIHPGSRSLRIGRATDTLPVTIPHVMARRHKQGGQPRYEDAWLLREGLNVSHSRSNGQILQDNMNSYLKKITHHLNWAPRAAMCTQSYYGVHVHFISRPYCPWPSPSPLSFHQKPESKEQRQNGLKMVDQAIWSKKMSNGVRRTPVSAEQVCCKQCWD